MVSRAPLCSDIIVTFRIGKNLRMEITEPTAGGRETIYNALGAFGAANASACGSLRDLPPCACRHERPICRHISDTVTVSASGYEHHEQAIVPYAGEYIFLVRIPSHVLRLFMKHGRKGEVVLTYVHAAVVALENLSGV